MPQLRELYDRPAALEPLFPTDKAGELPELAADLLRKSAWLGGALHPVTQCSVVELLRTMNSYYWSGITRAEFDATSCGLTRDTWRMKKAVNFAGSSSR